MRVIKFIINIVLSFLLLIFILLFIIQNVLNKRILNEDYINAKIEATGFYNQLSIEIEDGFENYVYQSGLPEDTIEGIYNEEILKKDINSIISYVYGNDEIKTSEDVIKQNLNTKIQTYLDTNNIKLNDQGQANIESYENLISKEYRKKVVVSESLYSFARDTIHKISKVMDVARYVPLVGVIIIALFLIFLNRKNLLDAIYFAGISLLSCGTLFKVVDFFISKNIKFDGLMIYSKSVTNLFVNVANEMLNILEEYSTFLIICGVVSILVTSILNSLEKKKEDDEEKVSKPPQRKKFRSKPKQRKNN